MHTCHCGADCDCEAIPCQHLCLQFADDAFEQVMAPLVGRTGRTLTVSADAEPSVFLTYYFGGWRFEFHADHYEVVNPANGDRWRMQLDPYAAVPFLIQLVEKGH